MAQSKTKTNAESEIAITVWYHGNPDINLKIKKASSALATFLLNVFAGIQRD